MSLQLDHLFILTKPGSPEGDRLVDIGLVEGPSNIHPGQGTANRRFFCANTTIELLYISNREEAVNGAGKRLRFAERVCSDASPFGLVFRTDADALDVPFANWHYQADYFPDGMFFFVGENSDALQEPLCICMPPSLPVPASPPEPCNRDWTMTALRIGLPGEVVSPVLDRISLCEGVEILSGSTHMAEIEFNHHAQGQTRDLSPELPLRIHY